MKKLLIVLIPFVFVMCQSAKKEKMALMNSNDSLQRLVVQKDSAMYSFLDAFNTIENNLATIKEKEKIISVTASNGEDQKSREEKINDDIQQIYKMMLENKSKLANLQRQMKKAQVKNSELQNMINELQAKLVEKDSEIVQLNRQLMDMNFKIDQLNLAVDTLTLANAVKKGIIENQDESLHTAWYIYGSEKELKDKNVLDKKGGFIGLGAKNLNKDFDKSAFTKVDTRQFKSIALNAKKIRIVTNHPSDSYQVYGEKPVDSLVVKNPDNFWSVSKYLVIVVY